MFGKSVIRRDPQGVGTRVLGSALVAWPMVFALMAVHYLFDPIRSERGDDVLQIIEFLPAFCLMYALYMAIIYFPWRAYRTRRMLLGLILHILGVAITLLLAFLADMMKP